MAKEVTVHQWCDIDLAESEGVNRVEGRSITIQIDDQPLEIDLCTTHELELIKPLLDVLVAHGSKPTTAPTAPKKRDRALPPGEHLPKATCIICQGEFASGASIRDHYVKKHGQTEADARGLATLWCQRCGNGYESIQGLGMHLMRSHLISDDEKRRAEIAKSDKKPPVGKESSTGSSSPAPRKASQSTSRTRKSVTK